MERLPNEILAHIFSNLDFRDKEECIFVCRLWSDAIHSTVLFETLPVNGGYVFGRYQRYLDSQPSAKAQVKSLIINPVVSNRYILGFFQECFPKLRSLYVQTCSNQPLLDDNDDQSNQAQMDFIIPISRIEILEQYGCSDPSQCFLSLGVYKSLKKLVINKNGNDHAMDFDLLINTPNLISLTLENVEISTSDLNTIHSNLLYLKSLELNDIILVLPNSDTDITAEFLTPPDYLTALLITTRHYNVNNEMGNVLDCLQYIQHKYTNLLEFRFIIDSTVPIKVLFEEKIVDDGMLPLLLHIGSGLKSLEINCSTWLGSLFEKMNEFGFKARCLNLAITFGKSRVGCIGYIDDFNFIQKLTININSAGWIPYLLENLKSFKALHIKGMHSFVRTYSLNQSTIQLDDILALCPDTLDSLVIETFDVQSCIAQQLYSLTRLEIYGEQISFSVYLFISQCLPLLSHLKLRYWEALDDHMPLNNLNLKRFDLLVPRNTHVLIKTESDKNDRHFRPKIEFCNNSDPIHFWDSLRQMNQKEINSCGSVVLTFKLNSVKQLFINNMPAF